MAQRINKLELKKRHSTEVLPKVSKTMEQNIENSVENSVDKNTSEPAPSSIIKIFPNTMKEVTLPENSPVTAYVISCPIFPQSETLPQSFPDSSDHEYVHRGQVLQEPMDVIYINEAQLCSVQQQATDPKLHTKRHTEDDISMIPEKVSKVHSEHCCCACRDTLETILQKQEEILSYLKNGDSNAHKDVKFDLLPPMPFDDLNDFLDFDESLSNETVLSQLIKKLERLLVSIDKKSVSNILASIMTNELCKKISWIGIKDTIAFQNTNIVNHIIDILQDHHGLDVDVVKAYIAEWLRRCSDRIASELRKNKKRAQQFGYDDT